MRYSPFLLLIFMLVYLPGCKDKDTPDPVIPVQHPVCTIKADENNKTGVTVRRSYLYSTQDQQMINIAYSKPATSTTPYEYKNLEWRDTTQFWRFVHWGGINTLATYYGYTGGDEVHPSYSLYVKNSTVLNRFDFQYDTQLKLTKLNYVNTTSGGDWELNIAYNAQGNVSSLTYQFPAGTITFTVPAYDNHPTPYASLPYWKFFGEFSWDSPDPEPLITALSKNNPLNIHQSGTGSASTDRTISYTYGSHSYPVNRNHVETTSQNGTVVSTHAWSENYEYTCQ